MRVRVSSLGVVAVLVLFGCKEDLNPVKKTWTETETALNGKISSAKKAQAELKGKLDSLSAGEDAKAKELKGKADSAVAAIDKGIADAEAALKSAQKDVTDAVTTGKAANVKAAIEKGKAAVEGALSKLADAPKAAESAIDELKKYADELVAAAAVKAAKQPPPIDPHKEGPIDFPGLDFVGKTDKLQNGEDAKANLNAIAGLLNRCDQIKVELQDHLSGDYEAGKGSDKLSLKRAEAVKTWLVKQGKVKAAKISKVSGAALSDPLEAESKDDPEKLKTVRAKNERVRVKIVKACPKK